MALAFIIEDSQAEIDLLREAFKESETPVALQIANSAAEAFDYIRKLDAGVQTPRPNFILLDMNLPAIGGDRVLGAIKHSRSLRSTPVIVWTSGHDLSGLNGCKKLGADEIHVKPSDWHDYVALVKSMTGRYSIQVDIPDSSQYRLDD